MQRIAKKFTQVKLNLIPQAQDDGATYKTLAATGQLPDMQLVESKIWMKGKQTSKMNHNEYPVRYDCFELEPFECVLCENKRNS